MSMFPAAPFPLLFVSLISACKVWRNAKWILDEFTLAFFTCAYIALGSFCFQNKLYKLNKLHTTNKSLNSSQSQVSKFPNHLQTEQIHQMFLVSASFLEWIQFLSFSDKIYQSFQRKVKGSSRKKEKHEKKEETKSRKEEKRREEKRREEKRREEKRKRLKNNITYFMR